MYNCELCPCSPDKVKFDSLCMLLSPLTAGGFCRGEFGQRVKDGILVLCEEVRMARWVVWQYSSTHLSLPLVCVQIKADAVALADVLAPPDAILQSAIGRENGEVRQHR